MRLIVTNDDGIHSVFLHALVRALLRAQHTVYVVAPKSEKSWIGCAKSRHHAVSSEVIDVKLGCPTWTVDGTPSDCVNIGLDHLLPKGHDVQAVVSGINIGRNASLGFILASGTIGGAWEGAIHGLPGIAFSQDMNSEVFARLKAAGDQPDEDLRRSLDCSAQRAAELVPTLVAQGPQGGFVVHNVNFPLPSLSSCEVVRTVPAHVIIPGLFSPAADDGTHRFVFHLGDDRSPPHPLSDRAALDQGKISHTVLDYRALGHPYLPEKP
ncbi:MAG: 5'/3'-nucleotidase SurE [Opitutaceae bacterium]|nr:5'/3'-nucleotidase SurE [Opitutaceae bacterium]